MASSAVSGKAWIRPSSAQPQTWCCSRSVSQTSVQVVPGLLEVGKTYFYQVVALSGDIDVRASPHMVNGPLSISRVLSGKFTR